MATVHVHVEGMWPIAPGLQTMFYQAWPYSKLDLLMSVVGGEVDECISEAYTHPIHDL